MKLKELGLQILFAFIMLLLFEYFGFKMITNIIGYVFVTIIIIIFLRILFSIYEFIQHNKETRFKANVIDYQHNWYKKVFGFVIGYFMWLMLKSK